MKTKIKFNKVTWYSKLAAIIFFIAVLPVWSFYLGAAYQETVDLESGASEPSVSSEVILPRFAYTNSKSGWGITLPPEWRLKDDKVTGRIIIESAKTVKIESENGTEIVPVSSVAFATKKASQFSPVKTKVGNIKYDAKKKALTDTSASPARCLAAYDNYGKEQSIPVFMYGGSTMSTPAYRDSAALLSDGSMLLISETIYRSSKADIADLKSLYRSLKLAEGVEVYVPDCAKISPQN